MFLFIVVIYVLLLILKIADQLTPIMSAGFHPLMARSPAADMENSNDNKEKGRKEQ